MKANKISSSSSTTKFKGVRRRSWGRWVSEIRLPKSRDRIWLGSFSSAEEAACAFDAATLLLRGPSSSSKRRPRRLNLPHLQLSPFLNFCSSPLRPSFAAADPTAFKCFVRSVAISTVASAQSLPQSPSCSVDSNQHHPPFPSHSRHSCSDSITAESTTDDTAESCSPSPASSDIWPASPGFHRIDGPEHMEMNAICFEDDLTVLRELEGYLATDPF